MAESRFESVAVAYIRITGARIVQVREGWATIRVPVLKKGRSWSIEVLDNRLDVVSLAEQARDINLQIIALKRHRVSGGKTKKDLEAERAQLLHQFQVAFRQPANVSIETDANFSGTFEYQRYILNEAKDEDGEDLTPTTTLFSPRTIGRWKKDGLPGKAQQELLTPGVRFSSLPAAREDTHEDHRDSARWLHMVMAHESALPLDVLQIGDEEIVKLTCVHGAKGLLVTKYGKTVEETIEEEEAGFAGEDETTPVPETDTDTTTPPATVEDGSVILLCSNCQERLEIDPEFYLVAETLACPHCEESFLALAGGTPVNIDPVIARYKITEPELARFKELGIETIADLSTKVPAELKKAKAIKLERAQELVANAMEVMETIQPE
jgi:hypothetical protein